MKRYNNRKARLNKVSGGDIDISFGKGSSIESRETDLIDNGFTLLTQNKTNITKTQINNYQIDVKASIF